MYYKYLILIFIALVTLSGVRKTASNDKISKKVAPIELGAYYFDGWTGQTPMHIPFALVDSFPEREPVWGWLTSSQKIINAQVDAAADAGLSFFSFCWYYSPYFQGSSRRDPKNHALLLFRNAPNKNRLKYCLLVANHQGYMIGPKEWNIVAKTWIDLFKDSNYLKANGKPLIIFFSMPTLISQFGSAAIVHKAFDSLREAAIASGMPGISIAACSTPSAELADQAKECGFDMLTGYNYHSAGLTANIKETPIDSMTSASLKLWQEFTKYSISYIPAVTLNWDPRPWANRSNTYATDPRYIGFSPASVYKDVKMVRKWLDQNPEKTPKEKIALLYAWNEYGEGAWLTPSRNSKENLLDGVKKAME